MEIIEFGIMNNIWLYIFCIIYPILIVYSIYHIYKTVKKHNSLKNYYPIQLRTRNNNILQYKFQDQEWRDIMAFDEKMKYIDKEGKEYIGPGFVPLKIGDDQTPEDWKCCLGSIQQIHEWETKAFEHYKKAIYEYLEMVEKKK